MFLPPRVRNHPRSLMAWILLANAKHGRPLQELLHAVFNEVSLKKKDRSLMTEVVLGVMRNQGTLEGALLVLLGKKRIKKKVRICFWLAIYQTLFLSRIPEHAIVHETMRVADGLQFHPQEKKFLRAGLSQMVKRKKDLQDTCETSQDANLPTWLTTYWATWIPAEHLDECIKAAQERPPLWLFPLQANWSWGELEATWNNLGIDFVPVAAGVGRLLRKVPEDLETLLTGAPLVVQSPHQYQAAMLCPATSDDRIMEIGSGLGGKTMHLAMKVGSKGRVDGVDLHGGRLQKLEVRLKQLEVSWVHTHVMDVLGQKTGSLLPEYDHVVVDAPCTNLAGLCRRPEVRWHIQPENLRSMAELQWKLVACAADRLKPGGTLLYITCTLSREENQDIRDKIQNDLGLKLHKELETLPKSQEPAGGYACLLLK